MKGYNISYNVEVHDPPLTREQADALREEDGRGASQAIGVASLIYGEVRGIDIAFSGRAQDGGRLPDADWLAIWIALSGHLMVSTELNPDIARMLSQQVEPVVDALRKLMVTP